MAKGIKEIQLTGKHGKGKVAIVDEEDFQMLSKYGWFFSGRYVQTNVKTSSGFVKARIHRMIMNPPKGKVVDHINGNSLDNRKTNLRICSQKENTQNRKVGVHSRSGHKGVSYNNQSKRWTAYVQGKHLGYFGTKEEASNAYDYHALELFGEYARLNSPGKVPTLPTEKKLTSKYKGISWCSRDERFVTRFTYEGKIYGAGSHKCEEEAAKSFNEKVREVLGNNADEKLLPGVGNKNE